MIKETVLNNRSYRRFDQAHVLEEATLEELVELARQTPSANNMQPLKYVLSADPQTNARIFPCLVWAAKLDWEGPAEGERPTGYIVILGDQEIAQFFGYDCGIAAQTIMLGAAEKGLGGCMLGAIDRESLRQELSIPEWFDILLVLALGKPAEQVKLEEVGPDGDVSYWRDADGIHHVPKRRLADIIWRG